MKKHVIWLDEISLNDIDLVGGKNASLGEMISSLITAGIDVPGGFVTTTSAYNEFMEHNNLHALIDEQLDTLDFNDVDALANAGHCIRNAILAAEFPLTLKSEVAAAYHKMLEINDDALTVAVRSSATAEDLPDASFAGQQESYLNISGIENVIDAIKAVFSSLYNNRAINYRATQGVDSFRASISVTVQRMIRSDMAASGVMFTLDTESGFKDAVCINAAYGLGESVVQGMVNPDEFIVYKSSLKQHKPAILSRKLGSKLVKMINGDGNHYSHSVEVKEVEEKDRQRFCLNDKQVEQLARYALIIEQHYGRAMDIEWALDGVDGKLYIVQARPETVISRRHEHIIETYELTHRSDVITCGRAIGQRIGSGKARIINHHADMNQVQAGDVLVTHMTDPDWEPVMKRAAAIITDAGGRTCHAAIIARELGVPAIVGCGNASEMIADGQAVTASCAEGETGQVYKDELDFEINTTAIDNMPELDTSIMMNLANPELAFSASQLPNAGVGLARLEFIISSQIGIHPRALIEYDDQPEALRKIIDKRIAGYSTPVDFYVNKLAEGIATIAAAFNPKPVIVRLSDFKSNEYANLLGGEYFEPSEENPMLGYRGAARYLSDDFRPSFELECKAIRYVRNKMGLSNVEIMVPFCRTVEQAKKVTALLASNVLKRGDNGLRVIMMCEIPSNALMAEAFLQYFDGFSIGSNDMTQLVLGLDRDSSLIAGDFDERNTAVKKMLSMAISACKQNNKYIGICGQGPSDYPDFAEWLIDQEITSISLNPDTVIRTWQHLAQAIDCNKKFDQMPYLVHSQVQ